MTNNIEYRVTNNEARKAESEERLTMMTNE